MFSVHNTSPILPEYTLKQVNMHNSYCLNLFLPDSYCAVFQRIRKGEYRKPVKRVGLIQINFMKKLSIYLVAFSFIAAFGFSTPANAFADKGSQQTRTETTECESGVKSVLRGQW